MPLGHGHRKSQRNRTGGKKVAWPSAGSMLAFSILWNFIIGPRVTSAKHQSPPVTAQKQLTSTSESIPGFLLYRYKELLLVKKENVVLSGRILTMRSDVYLEAIYKESFSKILVL